MCIYLIITASHYKYLVYFLQLTASPYYEYHQRAIALGDQVSKITPLWRVDSNNTLSLDGFYGDVTFDLKTNANACLCLLTP